MDMSYWHDDSLKAEPVTEHQSTPVLPEERHVFEFLGLKRTEPDEYRKEGGIGWAWKVFLEDGRTPFVFDNEQYVFKRTTNHDRKTRNPLFTLGTDANDWASALLGRTLGVDAVFDPNDMVGKRMSAMVIWERQKRDKTKWTTKLASLRHVPAAASPSAPAAPVASSEAQERAELIALLTEDVRTARKLKLPAREVFQDALDDVEQMSNDEIQMTLNNLRDDITAAAVPA